MEELQTPWCKMGLITRYGVGSPLKYQENIHFTNIKCKTQWDWQEIRGQSSSQAFMGSGLKPPHSFSLPSVPWVHDRWGCSPVPELTS